MKQFSAALQDDLYDFNQHTLADCYAFEFAAPTGTKYWTTYEAAITSGVPYVVGPGLERGDTRTEAGVKADQLSITLYPDASTIDGLTMFAAAVAGKFDGVKVTLARAYMITPGSVPNGLVTEFAGWVSRVEPSSTEIRLTVQSLVSRLPVPLPKRKCAAQCSFRLYDSATCGVVEATYTTSTTAASGSTTTKVRVSATQAADYFKIGTITVGGVTRGILASRDLGGGVHEVDLAVALSAAPSAGTACVLKRGCDRSYQTCRDRFSNIANFGGFAWAPASADRQREINRILGF
jgi:uncharacterized phage protein (TIGR02218 family)